MINPNVNAYKNLVKAILKGSITPLFQTNSFTKSGNIFYKIEKELVKLVNLEYFRFNSAVSFSFWFNIKIYCGNYENAKKISEKILLADGPTAFFRKLGYLWNNKNHMYQITPNTDPEELQDKIVSDFTQKLFPFYNKINTFDDVINFLKEDNRDNFNTTTLAILLAIAGRKEESKEFFKHCPGDPEMIKNFAQLYGVTFDD